MAVTVEVGVLGTAVAVALVVGVRVLVGTAAVRVGTTVMSSTGVPVAVNTGMVVADGVSVATESIVTVAAGAASVGVSDATTGVAVSRLTVT